MGAAGRHASEALLMAGSYRRGSGVRRHRSEWWCRCCRGHICLQLPLLQLLPLCPASRPPLQTNTWMHPGPLCIAEAMAVHMPPCHPTPLPHPHLMTPSTLRPTTPAVEQCCCMGEVPKASAGHRCCRHAAA